MRGFEGAVAVPPLGVELLLPVAVPAVLEVPAVPAAPAMLVAPTSTSLVSSPTAVDFATASDAVGTTLELADEPPART